MMDRPKLSQATRPLTFDIDAINERGKIVPTAIAGEHPLSIYADKRIGMTMIGRAQGRHHRLFTGEDRFTR